MYPVLLDQYLKVWRELLSKILEETFAYRRDITQKKYKELYEDRSTV